MIFLRLHHSLRLGGVSVACELRWVISMPSSVHITVFWRLGSPNYTKATHGATFHWRNHVTEHQLEQVHLNCPSLENAVCKPHARDPLLISVCLCVSNFRQRTLLRSSHLAFCQQKTPFYSQFSRILLSLLFSTLPDGFQTISFRRLIQSNKFIICAWSVTKER